MNAGGGYNSATSIFTCPVSGFYYIYFNGHVAFHAADEAAHIMKDGANMAMVSMNVSKILVTCKFEDLSLSTNNLYDFQAVWYITSGTNMESMVTESVLLECQQGSQGGTFHRSLPGSFAIKISEKSDSSTLHISATLNSYCRCLSLR